MPFVSVTVCEPRTNLDGLMSNNIVLGMPFFYDRAVYFRFSGKRSPLGLGPTVSF